MKKAHAAENYPSDSGKHGFYDRLMAVPHSQIKVKLDSEKAAKKRTPKAAFRAYASSPKRAN